MHAPSEQRRSATSHRYRRHQPEDTSLYPIVERHLSILRDELEHHEISLPRFVLTEFQDYLRCGRLEHGFVRVKCNGCSHEHLVTLSCKRRGFCPSCGSRRMIETSAHLVDHVIPEVLVSQWVLSFPFWIEQTEGAKANQKTLRRIIRQQTKTPGSTAPVQCRNR